MTYFAVTGATGFLGSALLQRMATLYTTSSTGTQPGKALLGLCRREPSLALAGVRYLAVGNSGKLSKSMESMAWAAALHGVDVVVHTAAKVHVMADTAADPMTAFRAVNVDGTLNLAQQAATKGVKRFVFISSVKVNGENTPSGKAFTELDAPNPQDSYAHSKHQAEQGLRQLSADTSMEVVIIRPPLVYGPGVKANFAALMRAVQRGWPLPLGAVHNQRSLVALDNLVDFILICITHPKAANKTFLVSDVYHRAGAGHGASSWGASTFVSSAGVGFAGGGYVAG